jgi:hypothetical protein
MLWSVFETNLDFKLLLQLDLTQIRDMDDCHSGKDKLMQ